MNYKGARWVSSTLVLALLCFFSTVGANAQQCMASYYRAKSPVCLDEVLAQFRQKPPRTLGPNPVQQSAFLPRYSGTLLGSGSVLLKVNFRTI